MPGDPRTQKILDQFSHLLPSNASRRVPAWVRRLAGSRRPAGTAGSAASENADAAQPQPRDARDGRAVGELTRRLLERR